MKRSPKRLPVAQQIRKGLEEAIQHLRREITLKTTVLGLAPSPPEVKPEDLVKLRLDNQMSQTAFARLLNVSTKSIQSWEQGLRRPSQAALRLIQVLRENPSSVLQVVGLETTDKRAPSRSRATKAARPGRSRSGSRKAV